MTYFAIIGDIIASKELEERAKVQELLKNTLNRVNEEYSADLASDFSITLGDEFQGLLKTAKHLLEIIDVIRFQVHPVQLRFGIGIGAMSTEVVRENSLGSDGPADWAAREAIRFVHDNNDYGTSKMCIREYSDTVAVKDRKLADQMIELANKSLKLCDRYETAWTASQYEFVRELILKKHYVSGGKYNQREIAQEMDISPQLVNSKIKNTGVASYVEMKVSVQAMLWTMWG